MKKKDLKVKVKKLDENAVIPFYATEGAAGMDLTCVSIEEDEYSNLVYHTGIAFEIPQGYVGLLFPRSSNSKKDLDLTNCVGVIDSDYRGEVTFKYRPRYFDLEGTKLSRWFFNKVLKRNSFSVINYSGEMYEVGDRVGQIVIMEYPKVTFVETDNLSETKRGNGGYGHTGK